MFGSPNIQNRHNLGDSIVADVNTLPYSRGERIHLTLKKQRISDNIEATKAVRVPQDELADFSAGINERESLQMTPKCFKRDNYLKVDRGSTGRKWGYLKASTESKKNLVSLFNAGTTRPMPLTGCFDTAVKDPGHNID